MRKKETNKTKVAIGMSGGVDSSVAAKILKDQGYEVVGLFMKLWHDPCGTRENACCDQKALMDARAVADQLGIAFYEIDARKVFKKEITDYFVREYGELKTPNPCVLCNKMIKFGWMLDFAEKIGCDYLATGHYARIGNPSQLSSINDQRSIKDQISNNKEIDTLKLNNLNDHCNLTLDTHHLLKGVDVTKDQSYFLWQLDQKQLSKIIFPLGEMTKLEVRKLAKKWNLPTHEKAESQEICFVENDYREFLRRHLGEGHFEPGNIVDKEGNIIGRHEGLVNYTIGQRRNVNQELRIMNHGEGKQPLYVTGFDSIKNELQVGEDKELFRQEFEIMDASFVCHSQPSCCHPRLDLGSRSCVADSVDWIPALELAGWNDDKGKKCLKINNIKVKIRYKAEEIPCSISETDNSKFKIHLSLPVRAITPGQSAVFYFGDEVIGGGIIC